METFGKTNPLLSIVVPLYNEEKRLANGFDAIYSYIKEKPYTCEIILVNDGSTDKTYEMLNDIKNHCANVCIINNKCNMGKGSAVKNGVLSAKGDIILFTDIDLSVPISYIDDFAARIQEGYDAAIGSRRVKGSIIATHQSFIREFMGIGFTFISNMLLDTDFSDHTCGMKAFKKNAAYVLFNCQKIERWAFDSEILFLSKKIRLKVIEVPVLWRDMPGTKVKMFRDAVRSFIDIARIRFYHRNKIG